MRNTILLFALSIALCDAMAQSEAYYAGLLTDPAITVTGTPITIAFEGSTLSLAWSDIELAIKSGEDMLMLPAVDAMRLRDGRANDPMQDFEPEQLEHINQEVRANLLRAASAASSAPMGFGEGGSGVDVNSTPSAFNQAAVLDAVAQVIVDRVKEELALAYFDKMAVKMDQVHVLHHACNVPKAPQGMCTLTELMPATQLIFKESRDHISSHVGATLKAAFVTDLKDFPANFTRAYSAGLAHAESAACGGTITDKELAVLTAGQVLTGVTGRQPWMDVLQGIADTRVGQGAWWKRRAALDLSLRLIESLVKDDGSFDSLKPADWPLARQKAYIGLLLANPRVKADLDVLGISTTLPASFEKMGTLLAEARAMIAAAEEIERIASSSGFSVQRKSEPYLNYVQQLGSFLGHGFMAVKTLSGFWPGSPSTPEELIPRGFEAFFTAIIDLQSAVLDGDYGKASLQVLRTLNMALPADSILDHDLVKLVTLAADIAEAGNGDVKEIFEAAIMPVGSFRVKQSTSFSATLNAYPGIFFGAETLQGSNSTKGFGGVAGPIGVALSWSKGNERTLCASNSLMLGIIDIGALLTYRFDNEDSVSANSEVTFSTVLAPGLFALHGFKGSPISCGIGVQYAPRLRGVRTDVIDLAPADALRIGAMVAVDIPLFPLSLKRRPVRPLADAVRATEAELKSSRSKGGNAACVERRLKREKSRLERALR